MLTPKVSANDIARANFRRESDLVRKARAAKASFRLVPIFRSFKVCTRSSFNGDDVLDETTSSAG